MRLLAAALCALLAAGRASAQQDERWDARLTSATGSVSVQPASGGEAVEASEGMPLDEGDRIVTGDGATAEISLDGESLITLSEKSDFTLEKTAKGDSTFSLAFGSLLAKIESLGRRRLSVRTPASVAAVRGTEFGVDVDAAQESHVGVFDEGRVEVTGQGATEVLTPNQETSVAKGRPPLRPFALKRFVARRDMMRGRIQRLRAVREAWKKLPPGPRRRRRLKALRRRIQQIRKNKKKVEHKIQQQRRQQPRSNP